MPLEQDTNHNKIGIYETPIDLNMNGEDFCSCYIKCEEANHTSVIQCADKYERAFCRELY